MPYVTVTGARAHYVQRQPTQARRPPVVYIHGAGGSHQHWLYQVRDLPESVSCALDLPGHGRSEGLGRDSIAAYGDWLVAFLEAVGLDQAVLVGHSMGGAICLDVALRFPERVAGLSLVASGARLRVAPGLLTSIQENSDAAVRLICRVAFGPEAPGEMARLGRRQMSETPAEVLYGDFAACDDFDVMARLGEIQAPTLVLCGTQDYLTPAKYSTYLRDNIPGAALQWLEGAGHMVMVEQPTAVVRALVRFLEGL